MKKSMRVWLTGFVLSLLPSLAFASTSLTQVQDKLKGSIMPWASTMQTAAEDLFYALAAVEIAIFFLNHVLKQKGHEDLFTGIIKKTVTLMFFFTVINESTTWIPAIINGLAGASSALGGVQSVTPGSIAKDALMIFMGVALAPFTAASHNAGNAVSDLLSFNLSGFASSLGKLVSNSNPLMLILETLMCLVIALLAGIGVLMMALEFLMVQLESYLVMTLGIVMLAGGGLRFTSKYVGTYFDYAINVGVRLFALTAIASLVLYSLVPIITNIIANVTNPLQMGFEVLVIGAVIALLPKKASAIASSLLSGQSSFSGGDLAKEGAMVAGGTVLAGAAVAAPLAGAAMAGGAGSLGAAAGSGEAAGGAGSLSGAAGAGGEAAGAADGVAAPKMGGVMQPGGASKGGSSDGVAAPKMNSSGGSGSSSSSSDSSGEQRRPEKQQDNRKDDQKSSDNSVPAPKIEGADSPVGQGDDSGKADSIQSASGKTADTAAGGSASGGSDTPMPQKDAQASSGQSAPSAGGSNPAEGDVTGMAEGLAGAGLGATVAEVAKGGASATGSAAQAAPGAAAGSGQASVPSGQPGASTRVSAGGQSPYSAGGSSASQVPGDAGSSATETGSPAPEGVSDGQSTAPASGGSAGVPVPQDVLERLNQNLEQMNEKPGFVERRKAEIVDQLDKHVKGSTIGGGEGKGIGTNVVDTGSVHKD